MLHSHKEGHGRREGGAQTANTATHSGERAKDVVMTEAFNKRTREFSRCVRLAHTGTPFVSHSHRTTANKAHTQQPRLFEVEASLIIISLHPPHFAYH
jgi:hypothetical protein